MVAPSGEYQQSATKLYEFIKHSDAFEPPLYRTERQTDGALSLGSLRMGVSDEDLGDRGPRLRRRYTTERRRPTAIGSTPAHGVIAHFRATVAAIVCAAASSRRPETHGSPKSARFPAGRARRRCDYYFEDRLPGNKTKLRGGKRTRRLVDRSQYLSAAATGYSHFFI